MNSMNPETASREALLEHASAVPLESVDISNWYLAEKDAIWPYFARLRAEAPVFRHPESRYGPFWSISRFEDIKWVDHHHELFSSAGSVTLDDPDEEFETPMFIAMDPPKHDVQRKAVQPVAMPRNLVALEPLIRARVADILDALPVGETFNWVDRVSIELTTQMLATLLDFPFDDRRRLTRWSDIATGGRNSGLVSSREEWRREMLECLACFTQLWRERAARPEPGNDLISMLAHGESTRDMVNRPLEYLGNLMLLIVGGNDTTRNSISGGVLALNRFPEEYDKLREDPSLIPNMVAEIIRWQTPLAYMRRTATEDVSLRGQTIRKGDKVAMWYVSGNRDEDVFEDADRLVIDRPNARNHLSFGYGIHRCMGNRVAELQLRLLWEEIQKRFHKVEIVGEPVRYRSAFIRGYSELPVQVIPND